MDRKNFFSVIGLSVIFIAGCGSPHVELTVDNQSGQRLENVAVRSDEKYFRFGVLVHDGQKSYMTAEKTFGRKFSEKLTLEFQTVDGEEYSRNVKYVENAADCRKLMLVIASDFEVTGIQEPTAD